MRLIVNPRCQGAADKAGAPRLRLEGMQDAPRLRTTGRISQGVTIKAAQLGKHRIDHWIKAHSFNSIVFTRALNRSSSRLMNCPIASGVSATTSWL